MKIELEELRRRISTIQTESDDFVKYYISKCKDGIFYRIDEQYKPTQYIDVSYNGENTEAITRLFREYAAQFYPDFVIDQTNIGAIEYMVKIAAKKSEKRGIVLHGPVGSGKTMLLLLWAEFRQKVMNAQKYVVYFTPTKLAGTFIKNGYEMFEKNLGQTLILDDIGINCEGNYFGTKTNVLAELIYSRYNSFKKKDDLELYCTTNLLSTEIQKVIGERAWSRLQEMTEWNEGSLTTKDRRKGTPAKRWPEPNTTNIDKEFMFSFGDPRYVSNWEGIEEIKF